MRNVPAFLTFFFFADIFADDKKFSDEEPAWSPAGLNLNEGKAGHFWLVMATR